MSPTNKTKKTDSSKNRKKSSSNKKSQPAQKIQKKEAKKTPRSTKLKILMVASECTPFAKTGGLADVVSALSKELAAQGHDVRVILPRYRGMDRYLQEIIVANLPVPISHRTEKLDLYEHKSDGVTYYFVAKDRYYNRSQLYGTREGDYQDNCERFTFFSRSILEICPSLNWAPDVIHCHDWQTGLVPVYLKTLYKENPFFKKTKTVFTIHNIAYQGIFWHLDMHLTGLPWDVFTYDKLEFYGKLNYLKGGIVFADKITTVSPRYAEEIQTPEFGCGLHEVLKTRKEDLVGILNGVDLSVWTPSKDPLIKRKYSLKTFKAGKNKNKEHLQIVSDIRVQKEKPLVGMISRLVAQKGLELIAGAIEDFLKEGIQFVFLGVGEPRYENFLSEMKRRYPETIGVHLLFDETLAHQIEAGADIYIMPSLFEPCGLNQMYSQIYGTIPVARETGGLADTIIDYNSDPQKATGFLFKDPTPQALKQTLSKAIELWQSQHREWKQLVENAMTQNFSWKRSASRYLELYLSLK